MNMFSAYLELAKFVDDLQPDLRQGVEELGEHGEEVPLPLLLVFWRRIDHEVINELCKLQIGAEHVHAKLPHIRHIPMTSLNKGSMRLRKAHAGSPAVAARGPR